MVFRSKSVSGHDEPESPVRFIPILIFSGKIDSPLATWIATLKGMNIFGFPVAAGSLHRYTRNHCISGRIDKAQAHSRQILFSGRIFRAHCDSKSIAGIKVTVQNGVRIGIKIGRSRIQRDKSPRPLAVERKIIEVDII